MEIVFWELVVLPMEASVVTCQFRGCDSLFRTCGCLHIEDICVLFLLCFIQLSTSLDLYLSNNLKDCAWRWRSRLKIRATSGRLGVQIQVATDLTR